MFNLWWNYSDPFLLRCQHCDWPEGPKREDRPPT
jgi:hypothetical protein